MSQPESNPVLQSMIERYSRLVRSAVARVAGPLSDSIADDVEQNVFIALWRAMPGEQEPANPSSYLYRAAVRETVRALRRQRRGLQVELDVNRQDPLPTPDERLDSRELNRTIRSALSELSPERRRAVQAHLLGYDVREIMAMQGWSYNKARNLIARGVADLRQSLERRGVRV